MLRFMNVQLRFCVAPEVARVAAHSFFGHVAYKMLTSVRLPAELFLANRTLEFAGRQPSDLVVNFDQRVVRFANVADEFDFRAVDLLAQVADTSVLGQHTHARMLVKMVYGAEAGIAESAKQRISLGIEGNVFRVIIDEPFDQVVELLDDAKFLEFPENKRLVKYSGYTIQSKTLFTYKIKFKVGFSKTDKCIQHRDQKSVSEKSVLYILFKIRKNYLR